ncbi:MAG: ribosome maturation factor RimP [Thermoleophilia bacterium]|nr:ribosome maturation factor RimP [Thermoleophilia bacterium]
MADMLATERKLSRDIVPAVERAVPGVEVLAVELLSPSRFCVYVDHAEGVDHALCSRVTEILADYREAYTVDVSSPGLDRPLRTAEHFRAAIGRDVQIRTVGEISGTQRFRGHVVAAAQQSLRIAVGETELDIPYEAIVRGNLIDEG